MDETKNFGRCHNWRQQAPILPKDPIQNSLVESNQNLNLWFSANSKYPVLHLGVFGGTGFFWNVWAARQYRKKKNNYEL